MTPTTLTVFEKYEVRKSRKQKAAFMDYVKSIASEMGYDCHTEKGYFGAQNIVIGNPDKAKVIYTAHYDTCAVMPFPNFITPKCILIYILYQALLTVVLLGVPLLITLGLGLLLTNLTAWSEDIMGEILYFFWLALLVAEMWLLMAGVANKHTANDNTSGVTTLLDIMATLSEELHGEVAFVFFDLEEMGLFGSAGFANQHKYVMQNTLLLNFDCVSDGNTMLFAVRKGAKDYVSLIESAFPSTQDHRVEVVSKGVFYPSDQANFACGVGVAALKTGRGGLLYMDRIHTNRDTVYDESNIAFLTEGAVKLARNLSSPHA